MTWAPPTPEEQVLFLRNIQRLLAEGQFVASYKFALLHALADLCVLKGDDSGASLDLRIHERRENRRKEEETDVDSAGRFRHPVL